MRFHRTTREAFYDSERAWSIEDSKGRGWSYRERTTDIGHKVVPIVGVILLLLLWGML